MRLQDFIGKTVEIQGVSRPVVLQNVNGQAAYVNDEGQTIALGHLSDSVGADGSAVKVRLSRIQG
jgi:hypothetical protein